MEKVMLKPRKAIDGTRCLTNQERGAYWDLINLMYLMGGPVHDDDRYLAGHCALHLAAYKRVRKSLVEKGKLHPLEGGKIIANHVEVELNMVESMLELRRKLGQSGGKASGKSRSQNKENKELGEANGSTPAKPPSSPSSSPSPPSKVIDSPPIVPPKGETKKRKTRIPDDFELDDKKTEIALRHGIMDPLAEFEHFKNHHAGRGTLWVDWDRCWVTWCCTAKKYNGNGGARGSPVKMGRAERAAIAMAERERRKQENGRLDL